MTVCTFFGHRDCPDSVRPLLKAQVEDLIREQGVEQFYVGNQGRFDALVRSVLRELSGEYPRIRYAVVLAYFPQNGADPQDQADTMLPEGIEQVHPRYALDWRNRWMLNRADVVVAYVTHGWGGAAKYVEKAKRSGKRVIDLA